jgi:hypothetical protein
MSNYQQQADQARVVHAQREWDEERRGKDVELARLAQAIDPRAGGGVDMATTKPVPMVSVSLYDPTPLRRGDHVTVRCAKVQP